MNEITRRSMLATTAGLAAAGPLSGLASGQSTTTPAPSDSSVTDDHAPLPLLFSAKIGMVQGCETAGDRLRLLKDLGYDGIEMESPTDLDIQDVIRTSREIDFPVHGVVNMRHWQVRLSDPDPAVREQSRIILEQAVRDAAALGGDSVLLVPGRVANADTENHDQVWRRSIEQIRLVLPLCARLGIRILIENVWNGFLYDPDGGDAQTGRLIAAYLDEINSPWVGAYYDLGNHQRYGPVATWVRTVGHRIVKLDIKGWGQDNGFCKIGDGDVDWPEVRRALREIRFTGWVTAEVSGGGPERLKDILHRMRQTLLGE